MKELGKCNTDAMIIKSNYLIYYLIFVGRRNK